MAIGRESTIAFNKNQMKALPPMEMHRPMGLRRNDEYQQNLTERLGLQDFNENEGDLSPEEDVYDENQ